MRRPTTRVAEVPHRPRGTPRKSLGALVAFSLLPAGLFIEAIALLGNYNGQGFMLAAKNTLWISLAACLVEIPWANPLFSGRIYAIRAFRAIGVLMAFLNLCLIAVAIYFVTFPSVAVSDPMDSAVYDLVVLLALSPLSFIYVRALLRVRWLDPASRPDEWEPPASSRAG